MGSTPAPGVAGRALAASFPRAVTDRTLEKIRTPNVFREGAENGARGGRAPFFISESRLNQLGHASNSLTTSPYTSVSR